MIKSMWVTDETKGVKIPQRVLVIGCGLIGTSFALALKSAFPAMELYGVDKNENHASTARRMGAFSRTSTSLPSDSFDLAVLAIPVDAACTLIPQVRDVAQVVMDVCSVKHPLCVTARAFQMLGQFAPTHPMAGLASEGPEKATGKLFEGQNWLFVEGWTALEYVEPLALAVGSQVVYLPSGEVHDQAMAACSHGVHLASLATILAYQQQADEHEMSLASFTGPGFRDVTRLAASPADFWVSTLLANGLQVSQQVRRIAAVLNAFASAIEGDDAEELRRMLTKARKSREQWQTERG